MSVNVAAARNRRGARRVSKRPALRNRRVAVRGLVAVAMIMAMPVGMAVGMCMAVAMRMTVIVSALAMAVRVHVPGVLVLGSVIVNRNVPLGPGHRPKHAGAKDGNDYERDAARQHERMELRAEQTEQHPFLQKIHAQADDAERPRQSDHADLIEEVGVVVVMMMGHV